MDEITKAPGSGDALPRATAPKPVKAVTAPMSDDTCKIEGCDKPRKATGWCAMHYQRGRATGNCPSSLPDEGEMMT